MTPLRSAPAILVAFCFWAAHGSAASLDDRYVFGPDSQVQPEIPEGRVEAFKLDHSTVYPGIEHNWWLYVPAGYDGTKVLPLMVFLDGTSFSARDGFWRTPIVLNNLIAKRELPMMAAIFIDPGVATPERSADGSPLIGPSGLRSVEYDTLSEAYATFLIDEILPEARKHVRITDDPKGRGIGGHSSGGICAFTVAWRRPDQFRKVYSANGSFVNLRGGDAYPALVRRAETKPIRVYQLENTHDITSELNNWPEANRKMAAALDEKGYDHQFVLDEGTHSPKHAASVLPDAFRWLWRDYSK